jgi:hypothetical protein
MVAYGRADTGRRRVRCSAMYESGTCQNKRSVYLDIVESLVLDGMREQLRDSRLIEAYVRTYNTQRERAAATTSTAKAGLESKLASLAAERNRMVDLIVKGVIDEEDGRQRLAAMKVRPRSPTANSEAFRLLRNCSTSKRLMPSNIINGMGFPIPILPPSVRTCETSTAPRTIPQACRAIGGFCDRAQPRGPMHWRRRAAAGVPKAIDRHGRSTPNLAHSMSLLALGMKAKTYSRTAFGNSAAK